jgi:hypothetical protein
MEMQQQINKWCLLPNYADVCLIGHFTPNIIQITAACMAISITLHGYLIVIELHLRACSLRQV